MKINVAIFKAYSELSESGMETIKKKIIDGYKWKINGNRYEFSAKYIKKWATMFCLKPQKFYAVIMPGANTYWTLRKGSPIFSPRWRNAVRNFVKNGGGYVGICGGATIACLGRKTRDGRGYHVAEFLKISNSWANQVFYRQDQYDIRNPVTGGIPLDIKIEKSGNPIFDPFYFEHSEENRSMRYWGGPAFIEGNDKNLPRPNVLGRFAEEPMKKAPLHWFATDILVKTDMKDLAAILATNYGNGKVILFGTHPEASTWYNGHIEENLFSLTYKWIGEKTPENYNWWMLRRAVAWVAGVPDEDLPNEFVE